MAKQVENRVVEMEFKNKDFEKAVAVTLDSIEKLNEKLDSLNNVSTKGFDEITKAANKVDFSKLVSGIETIEERFTTITGRIQTQLQDWVIDSIIKKPLQELEKVADTVFSTIVDKGKSRAQNLAQAKFQLEALGLTWEQIYDDMDYAVTGTAYGLDEAAMAASQFAAANVKLGDEMKAALRGISGVAAMTGRSYMEIAQIFTTVAGKGKAMNGEISRIEERGLGAKAAIADFINETGALGDGIRVTTNEIFDLASKGQISFEIFSKAMDTAFGEHATAANNLFTGALANTKAALGRIGERFATPIYEDIRQVLVELIPVINDFKKSLDPIISSVTKVTGGLRSLAVDVLRDIHASFDSENKSLLNWYGTNIDVQEKLLEFLNRIAESINGIGAAIEGGLGSTVGKIFLDILYNVGGMLKAIGSGITRVFGTPAVGDIVHVINVIQGWTEKLRLSEKTLNDLSRIISGIAAALHIVGKTAKAIWDVVLAPLLSSIFPVFRNVLDAGGDLADLLVAFDEDYHPFTRLYNDFNYFRQKIAPIKQTFDEILKSIKNFVTELTGIHDLDSFVEKMNEVGEKLHIADIFYGIAGSIVFALDNLTSFLNVLSGNTEFNEYVKSLTEQNAILQWISGTWNKIKTTIHDIVSGNKTLSEALGLDKLAEKFTFLKPILDTFKEHYKSIFEADEVDVKNLPFIDQFFVALKNSIKELKWDDIFGMIGAGFYAYFIKKSVEIKAAVAETFGKFVGAFQQVTEGITVALVKMEKETNAEKVLKIAAAVALLAGSILLLGKMNEDELKKGVGVIVALGVVLAILVGVLAKVMTTTKKMESETNSIMDPGATKKTTSKQQGKTNIITKTIENLAATLTETEETVEETIKDLSDLPALILAFGAAVWLIGSSIAKIAKVDNGKGNIEIAMVDILLLVGLLGIIVGGLAHMAALNEEGKSTLDDKAIKSIGTLFALIGVAIRLIAGGIATLAIIEAFAPGSIAGPALVLVIMLAAITTVMIALTQFANLKENSAEIVAAGAAMLMIGAALALMTIPLATLAALSAAGAPLLPAVAIVLVIMVEMGLIVALFAALSGRMMNAAPGMLAGTAGMLIMALAINALMVPISALTTLAAATNGVALTDAVNTIMILMAVMAAIALAFGVAGGLGNVAVIGGMIAGAAAMILIAKSLKALLVPLGGIMAMQKAGGFWEAFGGLAAGLGLLAVAALVAIPLAPGLEILMAVVSTFGAVVYAIGKGFYYTGNGVLALVTALALLQSINFEGMSEKIGQAGAAIVKGFTTALVAGIPDISTGFLALIAAGVRAIAGSAGMISEVCLVLILDVIKAIDNHAAELGFHLGHAINDIFFYAISGVANSIADIISVALGGEKHFTQDFIDAFFPERETKGTLGDAIKGIFGGGQVEDAAKEGAEGAVDSIAENVNSSDNVDKISDSFNGLLDSAAGDLDFNKISESMKNGGSDASGSLLEGMTSTLDINGGKSLEAQNLADIFGTSYTGTLEDYVPKARDQGRLLGKATGEGVAEGQDSHSPSKEAIKLGNYFVDGYVQGLNSDEPEQMAKEKAKSMISTFAMVNASIEKDLSKDSIYSPLSDAIASLSTMNSIDTDFQPTITPVLDLSNVHQGFSSLNSLFSAQRSMQLASDASVLNDAGRSLTYEIQNNNRNGTNSSINSLGSKLDRLGDALLNTQVVLDSGELVGGIASPMDLSLGTRAIMAQRA